MCIVFERLVFCSRAQNIAVLCPKVSLRARLSVFLCPYCANLICWAQNTTIMCPQVRSRAHFGIVLCPHRIIIFRTNAQHCLCMGGRVYIIRKESDICVTLLNHFPHLNHLQPCPVDHGVADGLSHRMENGVKVFAFEVKSLRFVELVCVVVDTLFLAGFKVDYVKFVSLA